MAAPAGNAPPVPPGAPEERKEAVKYVCAVCLAEQPIDMRSTVMCKNCAHEHGANKVFFKRRVKPTTYSTI